MDQDKEFEAWFEVKKKTTFAQLIAQSGEDRAKVLCREAWYGALHALQEAGRASCASGGSEVRTYGDFWEHEQGDGVAPRFDPETTTELTYFELHALTHRAWEYGQAAAFQAAEDGPSLPGLVAKSPTKGLLEILAARGGPAGALAEAGLLALRKGEDYGTDAERDAYFPFGLRSHVQMLHVKTLRLVTLADKPRQQHFEGVRDSVVDLINYGSFCADWLAREKAKETA